MLNLEKKFLIKVILVIFARNSHGNRENFIKNEKLTCYRFANNLNAIKDILNAIASLTAKSSSGELSQVVSSLNSISIGGSGGGGGTSKETIAEAVQYALDGLTINGAVPVVESIDKTGKATYKSNNVDFTIEVDEI